ncbi:hypothetical protein [Serratia phage SP1]|nr:hypothetical protein [Serratia phage SP1]
MSKYLNLTLILIMVAVLAAGFYREYSDSEKMIDAIIEVSK